MRESRTSTCLAAVVLGACASAAPAPTGARDQPPTVTVAELAASLRTEGYQPRFLGRQMTFLARVERSGAAPMVRIEGLPLMSRAVLHNVNADNSFAVGRGLQVTGLLVDQWYGVWQIWGYRVENAQAASIGAGSVDGR